MAKKNEIYQALDTQTVLVSTIDHFIVGLVLQVRFVDKVITLKKRKSKGSISTLLLQTPAQCITVNSKAFFH